MRRPWRGASLACAAGALFLVAGACSTDAPTSPPATLSTSSTASSTSVGPSSTTSEPGAGTTTTGTPTVASPLAVKAGFRPASLTPDQQAVVKAYDGYWVFRSQSLGTNTVDLSNAGAVASAQGIGQVTTYVSQQKAKGQHAAGEITTNVTGVEIAGTSATVTDCARNNSYDVKSDTGAQLSKPTGLVKVTITLLKQPSGWVVANINPSSSTCTVPNA